ncbi:hypothetical protein HI914_03854 [Erysiphe necator]|nr:hypothetical protein HI914_03854 [Erysiphe necator]
MVGSKSEKTALQTQAATSDSPSTISELTHKSQDFLFDKITSESYSSITIEKYSPDNRSN